MVCKEDVVSWFKELESYKRIDAMCSLLNMCLPFELRFMGTYLEELGKRDFQDLRGAELRANNPTDLATDIGGANTNHRTRRKMALYVSLLRSCNYACASTLYSVMVGLEQSGLLGIYGDPLEELLLLYTMALHHPAFTFDQHSHFGEILDRLKIESPRNRIIPPSVPVNSTPSGSNCLLHGNVTPNLSVPPPSVSGINHLNSVIYVKTTPIQGPPIGSEQGNELVNSVVGLVNSPMTSLNEPIYPLIPDGVLPPPPGIPIQPYNIGEFVGMGQSHWPGGHIMTSMNQPIDVLSYPPPPSPLMSQPSSPCDSRSGSPNIRVLPQSQVQSHNHPLQPGMRSVRRPSQDSTPPLPLPLSLAHDLHHHHIISSFNNLAINERNNSEEDRKPNDIDLQMKNFIQLHPMEKQNGMRRAPRSGRGGAPYNSISAHRKHAHSHSTHSSGSDSGSSTESRSPADTPAPSAPPATAPPRARHPPSPSPSPHYSYVVHFPRSAFPAAFSPYRPGYSPFPSNGEATYSTQYPTAVPVPAYAPPKSCFNCGTSGHSGHECVEPSIEDMTRAGCYQLDFSTASPDADEK